MVFFSILAARYHIAVLCCYMYQNNSFLCIFFPLCFFKVSIFPCFGNEKLFFLHGKMQKMRFSKIVNFRFLFSAYKLLFFNEKYFITSSKSWALTICKNILAYNCLHSFTDSRSFWQGFTFNACNIKLEISFDLIIGISGLDFICFTSFIAFH